jgi:hypothetical protein
MGGEAGKGAAVGAAGGAVGGQLQSRKQQEQQSQKQQEASAPQNKRIISGQGPPALKPKAIQLSKR